MPWKLSSVEHRDGWSRAEIQGDPFTELALAMIRRPGAVWLDSSSPGPDDLDGTPLGRYSFVAAEPSRTIRRADTEPDPNWQNLFSQIAGHRRGESPWPDAPPFVSGFAGMIGYEAAADFEPLPLASRPALSNCRLHLSYYPWVIARDHRERTTRVWMPPSRDAEDHWNQLQDLLGELCHPSPMVIDSPMTSTEVQSNFRPSDFRAAVSEIIERIRRGDVFQVNLAQTLFGQTALDAAELYRRLRHSNPAPLAAYYDAEDFQVLSSSPERFLRLRDRQVQSRPIKGTTRRTACAETDADLAKRLGESEKDRAENIMIVDLMRNDLSRWCRDDSIAVPALCRIEAYEFVQHLVSVVTGELKPEVDPMRLVASAFPAGSITGAPKIESMRIIAELEPDRRGAYCGSIGYLDDGGDFDWNVAIRTLTYLDGRIAMPVGSGITSRSDPAAEEAETWIKAEGMLRALR